MKVCGTFRFVKFYLLSNSQLTFIKIVIWDFVPQIHHTCQVLGKSKSEIARAPLIFAYDLVIERAEKSGAQV